MYGKYIWASYFWSITRGGRGFSMEGLCIIHTRVFYLLYKINANIIMEM